MCCPDDEPAPAPRQCHLSRHAGGATLVLRGEVDVATREELAALRPALAAALGPDDALVVDTSRVTFMDCAGWAGLLGLAGGRARLQLVDPSPAVALLERVIAELEARAASTRR